MESEYNNLMGNLLVCTGKYATTPYYLNTVCMNVYCIEELCYLFALNPFVITQDIMSKDIIRWLDEECDLKELAGMLEVYLRKGSSLTEFIGTILHYANYCDEDEIAVINETLTSNSGLSEFERKKNQADYYLRNRKFESAIEEYDGLLAVLPDVESALKPVVFHNIGYAYANLYMFDVAAKYFRRSYEMTGLIDSAFQFLTCLRMYLTDEKYLSFIADNKEYKDASLALEARMNKILNAYELSEEQNELESIIGLKDEGNVSLYYDEVDKLILGLKEQYIDMVMD